MSPINLLTIPLGFLMAFYVPGYALTWALFPKKHDIDAIERITLSMAFSVAFTPLFIFALHKALGVETFPIDAIHSLLASFIVVLASMLVWRIRKR
jgi:uncharacterized membrane protein